MRRLLEAISLTLIVIVVSGIALITAVLSVWPVVAATPWETIPVAALIAGILSLAILGVIVINAFRAK